MLRFTSKLTPINLLVLVENKKSFIIKKVSIDFSANNQFEALLAWRLISPANNRGNPLNTHPYLITLNNPLC